MTNTSTYGVGPSTPLPPPIYPIPPYFVKPKKTYPVDGADTVLAIGLAVMGYLAWDWIFPRQGRLGTDYFPGVAFTLYVCLALACSLVYFRLRKVRLGKPAIVGAALILLAVLPFTLYDTTPVHFFAWLFLTIGYVTWHAYAARTAISPVPGALTPVDVLNQSLVVPASNAGSWFAAVKSFPRGRKNTAQIVFAVLGVVVALPVIGGVLYLLMQSDASFDSWMNQFGRYFTEFNFWGFVWKLCLGIPVAMYLFALMYGNAHRMGTESITHERATGWARSARRITRAALVTPIAVLCAIYVMFFAAMGSSLFSAFFKRLPDQSTYADFARSGFFQLTAVAGINLAVLGFTYLFAKRDPGDRRPGVANLDRRPGEASSDRRPNVANLDRRPGVGNLDRRPGEANLDNHPDVTNPSCHPDEVRIPRSLRLLGAVLSGLTLLLVVTAMSKMVLYVDQYGLTRLRVYTLWFMGVLFVVFALVGLWHVRQFRVGTPIIVIAALSFLGLTWANTDAIIADYNVDRYLSGDMAEIDVAYLTSDLSDAAVPALIELRDDAPSDDVRLRAAAALNARTAETHLNAANSAPWTSWNWQSHHADRLLK